jgi:hypothetical protein
VARGHARKYRSICSILMIAVGEARVVLQGGLLFKKRVGYKRRYCGKSWDKVSSGWRCVDNSPFASKKVNYLEQQNSWL